VTSPALDLRGLRLKDRTRALQEAVGGVARAAEITGKSKSQHGRFQSASDADFATLADIVALEAVAPRSPRWPPVTRLLCELAGGVFLPLPDVEAHDGPVAMGIVALAKEFGELAGAIQEGLADGELQPEELLRARREGSELQVQLAAFLRQIEAMIEAEPPAPAALRRVENG